MKKLLPYILILVVLIGFLSPIVKTHAENPLGACTYTDSFGDSHLIANITNLDCTQMGGTGWRANSGLSTTSASSPNSTTVTASPCALGKSGVTFQVFSSFIVCNINKGVIPLIFALALMMFVWGVVQYVINSSEEAKKEKGRQFMIWGIIALAVMVSVWGLVRILGNTFGIDYVIPQVKS